MLGRGCTRILFPPGVEDGRDAPWVEQGSWRLAAVGESGHEFVPWGWVVPAPGPQDEAQDEGKRVGR